MDINDLLNQFYSMYKTNQAGFFRPVRDFVPMVHEISMDFFNTLAGKTPRSQGIQDLLVPFTRTFNAAVKKLPSYEYIPYPIDYEFFASASIILQKQKVVAAEGLNLIDQNGFIRNAGDLSEDFFVDSDIEYTEVPIEKFDAGKWAHFLKDENDGPSNDGPGITQIDEGFKIEPRGIGVVKLAYYRAPVKPVFAYTTIKTEVDVYLQYDKDASTQLEWSDTMIPAFLYKMGLRMGLKTNDKIAAQVGMIDKLLV